MNNIKTLSQEKHSSPNRSRKLGEAFEKAVAYIILSFFSIITLYPILWMIFGSLKSINELYINIWGPPHQLVFKNYAAAWTIGTMGIRIRNSIVVTVSSVALLLIIVMLAAYALARLKFPGRNLMFYCILGLLLIPSQVTIIPLFILIKDMGLLQQPILTLILCYSAAGAPFSIFIMRAFFLTIPAEIEEAALIDGANRFQVFSKIVLPLARPGIATIIIYEGMFIWNEFFLAFIFVHDPKMQTIPLGLSAFFFRYSADWNLYFAALSIITIPIIILYVIMQRQFIAGLSAGALKG